MTRRPPGDYRAYYRCKHGHVWTCLWDTRYGAMTFSDCCDECRRRHRGLDDRIRTYRPLKVEPA